jgi:ABC-type dipeptide/oligopeptide/nickel transport system permease subunit
MFVIQNGTRRIKVPRTLRLLFRNPLTVFGLFVVLTFIVLAACPVNWLPHDPFVAEITLRLIPPSWEAGGRPEFLLGTDPLGRDILSMIMHGARYSLAISGLATLLALLNGVAAGLISGYYRGIVSDVIMRLVDIQLAFPVIVLIIAVVAVLGPTFVNLIIVLGLVGWATYARVVRSSAVSLREKDFVEAARAVGATDLRIMSRHILPNTVTPIVIFTTFELARLLLLESALSFLGLGVQPPTPSWGSMIADGRQYIFESWWTSAIPGIAIVLAVLGFNLLGDGLRDVLDPLSRET